MVGVTFWMTSPSSSSTNLSTPCVLGCCGPMLTVIVSVRSSAISVFSSAGRRRLVRRSPHTIPLHVRPELFLGHFQRLVGLRRLLDLHRVVLAPWMPFPVVGHQQAAQIGVTVEHDPEHVPHFALGPAGSRPDRLDLGNTPCRPAPARPD